MRWRLQAVTLAFLAAVTMAQACPKDCECHTGEDGLVIAACRQRNLTQIPYGFPENLAVLDLGGNDFPVLGPDTLPELEHLQTLILDHCGVAEIRDSTFSSLSNLRNLSLSHNQITTVHDQAFRNTQIQYLYLDHNIIPALPDLVFRGLQLVDLSLGNNFISELTNGAFMGCTIENLNLNNNSLSFLSRMVVEQLQDSLRTFQLSGNQVPLTIERQAFQGLTLDSLSLVSSKLTGHYFLEHTSSKVIDISDNPFLNLDFSSYTSLNATEVFIAQYLDVGFLVSKMLPTLRNVRVLNLAHNDIITLRGSEFEHNSQLEILDLSYNLLFSLPDALGSYLPRLKTLQMQHCHLMVLTPLAFSDMANLTRLDLQNNKIQVLSDSWVSLMQRLGDQFLLGGNPFHCNCQMRWFRQWAGDHPLNFQDEKCVSPVQSLLLEKPVEEFVCREPEIKSSPKTLNVVPGHDVILTCIAHGDPAPEVEWHAPSGDVARVSPPANRTVYETTAFWRLSSVDSRVEGRYECTAINIAGISRAYSQLNLVLSTTTTTTVTTTSIPFLMNHTNASTVSSSPGRPYEIESSTVGVVKTTSFVHSTPGYDESFSGRLYITIIGAVSGCLLLSAIVIIVFCLLHNRMYKRTYDVNEPTPGQLKELNTRHLSTNHDIIRPQEHNQLLSQV